MFDEALAKAAAEEALRLNEVALMEEEDINILVLCPDVKEIEIIEEVVAEVEVIEEPEVEVVEEVKKEVVFSSIEKKMNHFLTRMKASNERNLSHPRRKPGRDYFMPFSFSDDINFDPFDSRCEDEEERLTRLTGSEFGKARKSKTFVGDPIEERKNAADFGDISDSVKGHKQKLFIEKMEQLYRTSGSDTSPEDWTAVFRTSSVDWKFFFANQEEILYERPATPLPIVDEEKDFLQSQKKLRATGISLASSLGMPGSIQLPDDTAFERLIPLPFGKVVRNIVNPEAYKQFQIEVINLSNLVTLELKVQHGEADVFIGFNEIPTIVNYDMKASAAPFNNKIARLTFLPRKVGTMFASVYSEDGALFELWSFATGDPIVDPKAPIANVSKELRGLEILANHSIEDLHLNFPKLLVDARRIVDLETNATRLSILNEFQQQQQQQQQQQLTKLYNDEDIDDDDIGVMDSFVAKAGRRLIKKEMMKISSAEYANADDEDIHNPNDDAELFMRPSLELQKSFIELVRAERITEEESLEYLNFTRGISNKGKKMNKSIVTPGLKLPSLKSAVKPIKYKITNTPMSKR